MLIWLLVILIGALAGVIVPSLWFLLQHAEWQFQSIFTPDFNLIQPYSLLASIALPFTMAGLVFFFFSLSRYYRSADGFTYFISDLHFNDGRRKFAYSIWHGLAAFALLVGGAIIGIEAFAIEFISAFGAVFAQWLRLPTAQVKTLTACGITAVVAALLGQPTTALLFTIELLYGWNGLTGAIGPLAISSFVAASVGKSLTTPTGLFRSLPGTDGGLSLLKRGDYFQLDFSGSILGILILSVLAAVAAAFLIWLCKKTDKEFHQLFNTRRSMDFSPKAFGFRIFLWAIATAAGFYFFSDALGTGANLLQQSQAEQAVIGVLFAGLLLRLILSVLSYTAIGSLGIFLPNLVFGAVMGATLALFLSRWFPLSIPTFTLLGMGAFFSAGFGVPVSATALVYGFAGGSISDNAFFLLAALGVNFLSHFLCGLLQSDRLASMGLYRHGIRFRAGMCFNTLSNIKVKDAMLSWITPIPASASIGEAYKYLMDSRFLKLPVVDAEKKLVGILSLSDFYGLDSWRKLGSDSQVHSLLGVEEIMKPSIDALEPQMSLEVALRLMREEELLPVVENADTLKYVGILLKSDMSNLYNKEVVKKAFRR